MTERHQIQLIFDIFLIRRTYNSLGNLTEPQRIATDLLKKRFALLNQFNVASAQPTQNLRTGSGASFFPSRIVIRNQKIFAKYRTVR